MAYLTTTTATGSGFTARVASAFDTLSAHFKERRLARETYNELNALTDRELADLGLARCELRSIARDSARTALR